MICCGWKPQPVKELIMVRALFVVAIVFCCVSSLRAEGQVDGVYFLPAEQGTSHFISIQGRSFRSLFRGMIRGEVKGHCNGGEADAGELSFFYFNGEEIARTEVTYGVVDGELWLGVFRRGSGVGKDNFHCNLRGMKFFGPVSKLLPEGQLLWEIEAETWRHYRFPKLASEETKIESVRLLKAAPTANGSVKMRPIFPITAREDLRTVFADPWFSGHSPSKIDNGRIGLFAKKDWEFEPEDETNLVELLPKPETDTMRSYYRQVGDVIIAPWSIKLGPVGLKPVAKKFAEVEGVWVDSTRADRLVEVIAAPKATTGALFRLGPPNAEEMGKRFSQLQYTRAKTDADEGVIELAEEETDVDTLHTQVISENCGMGHADWPGYIHWFATKDDKIVRYIYPSTHTPITNHPVNRTQVFKRR